MTSDSHTDTILALKGVRKVYGETVAVDDVDLALRKGEFLTFLGPSGSGKTTTLAMVAGLQSPSAGTILLDGQPLGPLPPYQRNIGMVFQHYALFPHMTVAGNVAFPLEMRRLGKAEIRQKVAEALALVGLPDFGARYPSQLSGGQQQRVALARAMVFRPPLLLMDEPLGALDKKLREQMQIEIMRLHRDLQMSVLYVTHDQEEALVMSDRIAVFNKGLIEQMGTAQELYERPVTQFVAGFLGDSNFFVGKITAVDEAGCLVDGPDGRFQARNTAGLKVGDAAVVGVRPERLSLLAEGDARDNMVSARVTEVIYLGQSRKYVMKTKQGTDVTLLEQAGAADTRRISTGDELRLGWVPAEANALAPTI
ncbi:putative spermidine/putrescine transport system ATP-binding protein [Rhodoligotrophos appendicifer]|uniref:ABC transporter ATP-binding protein n=1 Tax=Rhodoligotrophos appendicifer TaxID=987056 RepID=UPI00117DE400|nr:ABC transporter ATP-binding protein [Rhodoligotrophos appendicifer]